MKKSQMLKFQIEQLRQDKMIALLESLSVFIFCLFIAVFLPNILYRFVYASQQLTEAPKILELLPVFAFGLGVLNFLFVMSINMLRYKKLRKLEGELMKLSAEQDECCSNCSSVCSCDDHGNCVCGSCSTESMMMEKSDEKVTEVSKKKKSKK